MADHGGRTGRDTLDAVLQRISDLEGKVHQLQGGNRLSLDRGDTDTFPVDGGAFEGQVMIQYDTEQPWYFSNGEWRPFSTPTTLTPEYGLYDTAIESIAAGGSATLTWQYVGGATLLDLTAPTAPVVTAQGVYIVTANIECTGAFANTDRSIRGLLEMGSGDLTFAYGFTQGDATNAIPEFTMTGMHAMAVSDPLSIQINNKDSATRNIKGFNIGVLKAFDY